MSKGIFRRGLTKISSRWEASFPRTLYTASATDPNIVAYPKSWNKSGRVLKWDIKNFIHQGMFTVAEWYFECDYNHEIGGFDGVSIIEFNDDMKIVNLKEFQSKAEHYFPYR